MEVSISDLHIGNIVSLLPRHNKTVKVLSIRIPQPSTFWMYVITFTGHTLNYFSASDWNSEIFTEEYTGDATFILISADPISITWEVVSHDPSQLMMPSIIRNMIGDTIGWNNWGVEFEFVAFYNGPVSAVTFVGIMVRSIRHYQKAMLCYNTFVYHTLQWFRSESDWELYHNPSLIDMEEVVC